MRKFLASLFLLASLGVSAQTCKPNQYDMLQWMVPQLGTINGHANVLYSDTGTFYWVKGVAGYPWDVKTFDQNGIYDQRTENVWNDPSTFKEFEKPIKLMPRCIDVPAAPGKIAQVLIDSADSLFDIHSSCASYTTHSLGFVINEVWGPYTYSIGKMPPAATLVHSYRYSCGSEFNACKYKETYELQKNNGMMRWTYYISDNGVYVQHSQTVHALATVGNITPVHPCW
jgi:hypothetical protein